ncbi:hypothetical protein B566_EDAN013654 [Ephemera danica]|nr:hypothetical protein B566_EDAN013654 [Ephemera danica]
MSNPYCMRKQTTANLTGNDQFEGYGVDVIHELSTILGFNYTIQLVPDGQHGTINRKTKQWNGMIKELMENRADLAIADLTINFDRKQVVDFTVPFMNLAPGHVLVHLSTIAAGVGRGSCHEATSPTYRRMWAFMESARPAVLTKSNLEGVERVIREKGGYAFLMESVSIQYVTERNCELAMVGRRLDQKTYGIAVPKSTAKRLNYFPFDFHA